MSYDKGSKTQLQTESENLHTMCLLFNVSRKYEQYAAYRWTNSAYFFLLFILGSRHEKKKKRKSVSNFGWETWCKEQDVDVAVDTMQADDV